MREVKEHKIYEVLEDKYERVGLDYCVLSLDEEYMGEETHKKAVIRAFQIFDERFEDIDLDQEKMVSKKITMDELVGLPPESYDEKKGDRSYTIPRPIPYWFAFLEPPQGTPFLVSDFTEFNSILFSDSAEAEVYRWNDDFSNYFDAGKEWWGTGLWSVSDVKAGLMVVIGASLTD